MGRKTWDSLPRRPLPGRVNIVLSRDGTFAPAGALVCDEFSEAVQIGREQAEEDGAEEVCVIGGAALFQMALPRARRIYLTEIEAAPEGDVFFPPFDESRLEGNPPRSFPGRRERRIPVPLPSSGARVGLKAHHKGTKDTKRRERTAEPPIKFRFLWIVAPWRLWPRLSRQL